MGKFVKIMHDIIKQCHGNYKMKNSIVSFRLRFLEIPHKEIWVSWVGVHTGTTVPWGYRYNGEKYRCQTVLKVAGTFLPVLWLKMPLCWCSRQGRKECRDAGSAGKYIAIASSSGGRHFNCTTIDTNARSSTWKSVKKATLCILHGASPAPPHFSKH